MEEYLQNQEDAYYLLLLFIYFNKNVVVTQKNARPEEQNFHYCSVFVNSSMWREKVLMDSLCISIIHGDMVSYGLLLLK